MIFGKENVNTMTESSGERVHGPEYRRWTAIETGCPDIEAGASVGRDPGGYEQFGAKLLTQSDGRGKARHHRAGCFSV